MNASARSVRVLLVGNSPGDAELISGWMPHNSSLAAQLVQVDSLAKAIASLANESIDVVLLDLAVSDASASETVGKLLDAHPGVPVVVITGMHDEDVGMRVILEGAQDYLVRGTFAARSAIRSLLYAIERARLKNKLRTHMHTKRLAAVQQMAASVAHDINNPMGFIQVNLGGIADEVSSLDAMTKNLRQRLVEGASAEAVSVFDEAAGEYGLAARFATLQEMLLECQAGVDRIAATVVELKAHTDVDGDLAAVLASAPPPPRRDDTNTPEHPSHKLPRSAVAQTMLNESLLVDNGVVRAGPSVSSTASSGDPPRARVLLIDDEEMLRKALRRVLGKQHEVVEAQDGAEGLAILAADPDFQLILCDVMMPMVDGPGVYEQLALSAPALLERLVFLTGGAVTQRARDFIEQHEPTVLEKPIARDVLRDVVDHFARRFGEG